MSSDGIKTERTFVGWMGSKAWKSYHDLLREEAAKLVGAESKSKEKKPSRRDKKLKKDE